MGVLVITALLAVRQISMVYPKYCPASFTESYRAEEQALQDGNGVWSKLGLQQSPWE
jgi:hypothetical protein